LPVDRIISLSYFPDSQNAVLVFEGGDIYLIREEPQAGEDRIEIVGSVDAGISAAQWSPDEELLVITTKADTVVFMSRNLEPINEVTMTAEDLKASNHVSVGWGKKETQFQGRGAKALRDPTMPEKVDEGLLTETDAREVTISWRGDGAYVAISSIHANARRLIRVYSREGALDSVSEPVDYLEGALSWRPAGNLMAGIQRFSDHIDVVFFERNGLRHGQFSLRLTPEEMSTFGKHISLEWNSDSTVLAVIFEDRVQFWTMGNYHWYLKQEIAAKRPFTRSLVWHQEKPLLMLVAGADRVSTFEYAFAIARSSTAPPVDYGAVAVIDGKTLKLTPFRSAQVPPPYAHYELETAGNVTDVAFSADSKLIAVLYQTGFSIYSWRIGGKISDEPKLVGSIPFSDAETSSTTANLHIAFDENGNLVVLRYNEQIGESAVESFAFDAETGTVVNVGLPITSALADTRILSNIVAEGRTHAMLQNADGGLYVLKQNEAEFESKLPAFVPWFEVSQTENGRIAFSQSTNGVLRANDKVLAKNCTSFLLTPAHLIFTTTTHMLKFVHLASANGSPLDVDSLEVPNDDPEKDERCRAVERGAKVVTAMPSSLSLVLQMPRGNLETIWPRAMVLAGIRKLVDEKDYKKAFAHCRTQRVDMNLLYDHAPAQFLENIGLFLDQVKKITYIDLFLSSLREEDVTETLYKDTRVKTSGDAMPDINGLHITAPTSVPQPHSAGGSKVNKVCDAMLSVLNHRQSTNLQNIVTAHLCKSPPALDDGLLLVAKLMGQDEKMADKAVEHICFLADVNKLYDHALGLYNLDLALLVAQQSQKDPREYLPFLQGLQEMDQLRRQFSIDDHLQRYGKALDSLVKSVSNGTTKEEEVDKYIVKHALYQDALTIYRYSASRLQAITLLYAEYLEANSQLHSAALAYESLARYAQAAHCYAAAGAQYWRESLFCLSLTTPPPTASLLASSAQTLAHGLAEQKAYADAAEVYKSYLGSAEQAARMYCKAYRFAEAFSLAVDPRSPAPQLLEKDGIIDSGLTDALGSTTELLAECKGQLAAQVPRIKELRAKALADPLAFYEGERGGGGADIPDDVSVAASGVSTSASLFTRYTGRQSAGTAATGASRMTSKNRRREERKRARGKKGSVYEEEYLVASVGRLIDRVEGTRQEVERLVQGLLRRGMREGALAVEGLAAEVVAACKVAIEEVYGPAEAGQEAVEVAGEGVDGAYRPIGGDAVLAESLQERLKPQRPQIGDFKKLSLLGA
jgi:elongator complex protein 1